MIFAGPSYIKFEIEAPVGFTELYPRSRTGKLNEWIGRSQIQFLEIPELLVIGVEEQDALQVNERMRIIRPSPNKKT